MRPILREKAYPYLNHGHNDRFFYAFDEAFDLLYCDLKLLAGACKGAGSVKLMGDAPRLPRSLKSIRLI